VSVAATVGSLAHDPPAVGRGVAGPASPGASLLPSCAQWLQREGVPGGRAAHAFFVPGRIEVLGKHTDYAGGRSLLTALDRGFHVLASPRDDGVIRVGDVGSGESVSFPLAPDLQPGPGWHNYAMTVARRVARDFPEARVGADIAFASDLPAAAGMSSSSALIVSVFLALSACNALEHGERYRRHIRTREELAEYLAAVESGRSYGGFPGDLGVGTRGGSQDHTAILCARAGELVQYAFGPARFERAVSLPEECTFVIAASGVRAEKTGAALQRYNLAADRMQRAARLLAADAGEPPLLGRLLQSDPSAVDRLRRLLDESPHIAEECEALQA
jgi:galactokinase